ncbi:hypothetical protein K474DRAFT_1706331 [Panus rudis PR-1116 ss-1]|nr:hypothetical protein K474DRAFT_1706331 [Panus rudis PR-1116 ss-1]
MFCRRLSTAVHLGHFEDGPLEPLESTRSMEVWGSVNDYAPRVVPGVSPRRAMGVGSVVPIIALRPTFVAPPDPAYIPAHIPAPFPAPVNISMPLRRALYNLTAPPLS